MAFTWPEELQFMVNSRAEQKRSKQRLDGKVCVMTGTTSGVGEAGARRFAAGGAHLVMVCRNAEKARSVQEELRRSYHNEVDIVIADFSDLESVRAAAHTIRSTYPRIDVLVHNVGIFLKKKTLTAASIETVFCVNHLSPFLLNSLLLDRMIESAPSRIIYVNSEGHRFSTVHIDDLLWLRHRYSGLRSYGAAKSAQLLTMAEFDKRLAGTGVTINAMHPGAVKSGIGQENGFWYRMYTKVILNRFLKDPTIAGEALYYLASEDAMATVSGLFFNQTIEEKPARHTLDREYGRRVWETSIAMTAQKEV